MQQWQVVKSQRAIMFEDRFPMASPKRQRTEFRTASRPWIVAAHVGHRGTSHKEPSAEAAMCVDEPDSELRRARLLRPHRCDRAKIPARCFAKIWSGACQRSVR